MASTEEKAAPLVHDLFAQHGAKVARWVARLGGPGIEVDDLVQEVFLQVHRCLPGYRGEAQVTTWLFAITHNVVRAARRRSRWRWFLPWSAACENETDFSTPLDDYERRESSERLYRSLNKVSEKLRTVFILFEIEGMSGEKIAQLTDTPLATVWVQLSRARKLLATNLLVECERKNKHER